MSRELIDSFCEDVRNVLLKLERFRAELFKSEVIGLDASLELSALLIELYRILKRYEHPKVEEG